MCRGGWKNIFSVIWQQCNQFPTNFNFFRLCMKIYEPDSVTLLKTSTVNFVNIIKQFQAKQSTLRRSSLLRDLKRIKNSENCKKGHHLKRDLCECLTSAVLVNKFVFITFQDAKKLNKNIEDPQNGIELIENSPKNHKKTPRDVSTGESAFLGKIVKEQVS